MKEEHKFPARKKADKNLYFGYGTVRYILKNTQIYIFRRSAILPIGYKIFCRHPISVRLELKKKKSKKKIQ